MLFPACCALCYGGRCSVIQSFKSQLRPSPWDKINKSHVSVDQHPSKPKWSNAYITATKIGTMSITSVGALLKGILLPLDTYILMCNNFSNFIFKCASTFLQLQQGNPTIEILHYNNLYRSISHKV